MGDHYRVSDTTTVGEALFVVPGAEQLFEQHGCEVTIECTEEHHREYMLVDLSLTCHIDDTDALIADLNAAIAAEEAQLRSEASTSGPLSTIIRVGIRR
jgi:hypothetical protein